MEAKRRTQRVLYPPLLPLLRLDRFGDRFDLVSSAKKGSIEITITLRVAT